jgi:hypothetical protein
VDQRLSFFRFHLPSLFELELLDEFDELFELELLDEFEELFELELLDEFEELFELELLDEFEATCVRPPVSERFSDCSGASLSLGTAACTCCVASKAAPASTEILSSLFVMTFSIDDARPHQAGNWRTSACWVYSIAQQQIFRSSRSEFPGFCRVCQRGACTNGLKICIHRHYR